MSETGLKTQDDLFPTFPYITGDQVELRAPDYVLAAESGAELALSSGLIRSWKWLDEEVLEYNVMVIQTETGEVLSLSAMQAMILFKGIFLGYRRDRELEMGLDSQLQIREALTVQKRVPKSKRKSIPVAVPNRELLLSKTVKIKEARVLDGLGIKISNPVEEDDSWLDEEVFGND